MKKKIKNIVLISIACLLVAAQIFLMPRIANQPSKPPLRTEPQATILVFPLPATINIQSNLTILRTLFNQKTPPKSENTEGVDSTREFKIKN